VRGDKIKTIIPMKDKKSFAKQLRKNQTSTEKRFWDAVRNYQYFGLKFRRQVVIEPYIVDFFCPSLKLIIEFDGEVHDSPEQKKYDQARDIFLRSKGYSVIRIQNDALFWDSRELFEEIDRMRNELE